MAHCYFDILIDAWCLVFQNTVTQMLIVLMVEHVYLVAVVVARDSETPTVIQVRYQI